MEKESFQALLENYTSLTTEEGAELIALQDKYPYSQVIHNLCSRAAQDNALGERERFLHLSAIYTTERTVLKSIMSAPRLARKLVEPVLEKPKPAEPVVNESAPIAVKQAMISTFKSEELSGDALIKDLFLEMEKLKVSKKKYEDAMLGLDQINPVSTEPDSKKKIKKTAEISEPADSLIEEIKNKKKVKPDGPKQKEQLEIIENFIKTQPTIPKSKLTAPPPSDVQDLAEKSLQYGDSIVSETLVEILLKQGKKDKAIEVLKKLIWKFPQKKAYFAAQIEDLKK